MARREKKSEGTPGWVTTMSDMNTLLLTFFVMLVGLMTLEVGPKNMLLLEPREPLSTLYPSAGPAKKDPKDEGGLFPADKTRAVEMDRELRRILPAVSRVEQDIFVTIGAGTDEFAQGEWRLSPQQRRILQGMAAVLKRHVKRIVVKGYTDTSMFDSLLLHEGQIKQVTYDAIKDWDMRSRVNHWLLAYLRGREVANYLISAGLPADQFIVEPMAYRAPFLGKAAGGEEAQGQKRRVVQIIVSQTGF